MHNQLRWIGAEISRLNSQNFVCGEATYSADLIPADALFVALLRSSHARAKIKTIDVSTALASDGVQAIFTGDDVARLTNPIPQNVQFSGPLEGRGPILNRPLALREVNYVGHPIVAVVAESIASAQAALEHIQVNYDTLEPVEDPAQALKTDSPIVHPGWTTNVVARDQIRSGNPSEAFATAARIIAGDITIYPSTSAPIETRSYLAEWDSRASKLTLHGTFQNPHTSRWMIASALGLKQTQVRIVAPNLGGTFGLKMAGHPEEVLVAALSSVLKRPVAFVEERAECLLAAARQQQHFFEVAVSADGSIVGFRNRMVADVGAVGAGNGWSMALVTASVFPTVYDVPHCEIDCTLVATNKSPWQPIRGYGKEVANLVMERAIDLVAVATGHDPAEVRRRHLLPKDALPHRLPSGLNIDSGDYHGALNQLLQFFGYDGWRGKQTVARNGGKRLGIGVAFELTPEGGVRPGLFPSGFETATVRVVSGGEIQVAVSVTSPGSGNETGIAQLVADVISVRPDAISVLQGDTDVTPLGTGNASSRALIYGGAAAFLAATDLRKKLAICGANMLGANSDSVAVENGFVYRRDMPTSRVSIAEIAFGAQTRPFTVAEGVELPLECTRSFRPQNVRIVPDERGRLATYSSFPYSVHAAAVEVDEPTGKVALVDYAVVHDCGVMVNPLFVVGQLRGAVVMGVGAALWEQLTYDKLGHLISDRLKTYLLPRATDLPPIRVTHRVTPSPFHPLGMKGAGESGVGGALASVTNAVMDALASCENTSVQIPLTPPRLAALMQSHRK